MALGLSAISRWRIASDARYSLAPRWASPSGPRARQLTRGCPQVGTGSRRPPGWRRRVSARSPAHRGTLQVPRPVYRSAVSWHRCGRGYSPRSRWNCVTPGSSLASLWKIARSLVGCQHLVGAIDQHQVHAAIEVAPRLVVPEPDGGGLLLRQRVQIARRRSVGPSGFGVAADAPVQVTGEMTGPRSASR